MIKVGAVVLNYINYTETINCVESLLAQTDAKMEIAIVDNGSGNESVSVLRDKYKEYSNCYIIESGENLGYAKGNNLGIKFLKERGVKNIWVVNSDIVFTENRITRDVMNAYEKGVGLINVTSYLLDGRKNFHVRYKKKLMELRMLRTFLGGYWETITKKKERKAKNTQTKIKNVMTAEKIKELNSQSKRGCEIHKGYYIVTGSVFMLTEDFLNNYDGLFPETFFYCEEYATMLFLDRAGLKTAMVDTGIVLHKHKASTPKKTKKNYGLESSIKIMKLFFMNKEQIIKKYF